GMGDGGMQLGDGGCQDCGMGGCGIVAWWDDGMGDGGCWDGGMGDWRWGMLGWWNGGSVMGDWGWGVWDGGMGNGG
ncbi:unnamed protein product, partial [Bubo scandiacus]